MLQGTLNDFTLADVFSLLALTKKTGALRVTFEGTDGQVLFREGLICLALTDAARVPLAARLVSAGLVDETQVRSTIEQHSGNAIAVTEGLLTAGSVEDRVLALFLREQIVDAVFELFRLTEGSFNFDASAPVLSRGVGLSVVDVVGEATRRLEEWHGISEHIASPHAVLAMVPSAGSSREGITLMAEQWELLALIDGRRTVSDVVELTGRGEFATCRVLVDLVAAGLIQASDGSTPTDLDKLIGAREALRSLERVDKSALSPGLSSAAVLAPGTSRIRWVEPPVEQAASAAPARAMMASRSRLAEVPRSQGPAAPDPAAPVPAAAPPQPAAAPPADVAQTKVDAADAPDGSAATAVAPTQPPAAAPTNPAPAPAPGPAASESKRDGAGPVASPGGVDRAQVARELASLGLDDDSDAGSGLTRDGDVNKGLLLRLIDGVKGA